MKDGEARWVRYQIAKHVIREKRQMMRDESESEQTSLDYSTPQ